MTKTSREFHLSRATRDRYQFDQSLFSLRGNVVFANFHAARLFAQRLNQKRDLLRFPEQVVRAGQLNAMGLIEEIYHFVVETYRQEKNPGVMERALNWLYARVGTDAVEVALRRFADEFPPLEVYRDQTSLEDYLEGQTGNLPNRQIVLEELIMLWLANVNPAAVPFRELFDDAELKAETAYPQMIASLADFFEMQPHFGPENQALVAMLRTPAIVIPQSLPGQLLYIHDHWGIVLGKYLSRLLGGLDLLQEEERPRFGGGPGPARVIEFRGLEGEAERFSPDRDWMPSLVLLASNAFVWLDQLSKKYQQPIYYLSHIPDEELDTLARWGISGLWLIGLWERSAASQRIKQLRGNPEAVASAYSLFDYQIATDLGGEAAYQNLRDRCWARGIRLASDMVPNHMGIDSRWVIEHPDWFISLDFSPYPSHTFDGPNLSWDARVGIYLEDHYYSSSDAAVVFKRVDHWTGEARYIYHGNDGTSMPWNDTAQLDYLNPAVREAVIQTILHVARKFSIIRFDAAMTLAKKHYQRLWFPEPSSGGDIPTRAEHGLTKEQFDAVFPQEFWREVVDRVAQEVPDTLLLAEAFWLMEGYFVRTLGMHRVYNSAFMNMLRDEKNAEYRQVIKNTLEFDPEILKRYVNFMNNPDERTAVDQFGKSDKYFGVCTLLATLPGLPMFGHGQVEGFTEKYGMEFRRAYWDETPDPQLVARHEREIFPLLRKRYLFAEAKDFLLYDFYTPAGSVNEDVFAYTNRAGGECALVIYHNKYADTRGWIRTSVAYADKTDDRALVQKTLAEGLGLSPDPDHYLVFKDTLSGLEFLRSCREIHEQGLFVELGAYKCQVFMNFRPVRDGEERQYARLAEYLHGRGVPSLDAALRELTLRPISDAFRTLVEVGKLEDWQRGSVSPSTLLSIHASFLSLLRAVQQLTGGSGDIAPIAADVQRELEIALTPTLPSPPASLAPLFFYLLTHSLGRVLDEEDAAERSRSWIDEWQLGRLIAAALQEL